MRFRWHIAPCNDGQMSRPEKGFVSWLREMRITVQNITEYVPLVVAQSGCCILILDSVGYVELFALANIAQPGLIKENELTVCFSAGPRPNLW